MSQMDHLRARIAAFPGIKPHTARTRVRLDVLIDPIPGDLPAVRGIRR